MTVSSSEPQFLYMMLILPTLFGLTLIGEGLGKVLNSEHLGWLSIIFGFLFIGMVSAAYWLFSNHMLGI